MLLLFCLKFAAWKGPIRMLLGSLTCCRQAITILDEIIVASFSPIRQDEPKIHLEIGRFHGQPRNYERVAPRLT